MSDSVSSAASSTDTHVLELARKVRLLVLDVDGVLTDGGLSYDVHGQITKRFDVKDGLGIKLAHGAGLEVAVISGLNHAGVEARVRELGIEEYHAGHFKKAGLVEKMAADRGLGVDELAYMGDDLVDAGPMRLVGLPMAVADADRHILELARWISAKPGGRGAVREAINFILETQGKLEDLWLEWSS